MRFATFLLAVAASAALTGCSNLVSLNPFATEKQAVLDPNLPGAWKGGDGDSLFVVQTNKSGYSITYTDGKGTSLKLSAVLFKVGDAEILDLVNDNDAFLQVPVHAAVRVWTEGSQLRWTFLDSKWLREQSAQQLASQPSGEATLLTAPGESVRNLLLKLAADSKAYENDATVLTRINE